MQIELLKPHTHAGEELGTGSVIEVDDSTADWLIEHSVGQKVATADARRAGRNEANPVSQPTTHKE